MPKNKGKGGKNRRRGKNENETMKRELIYKEDGQEYAKVEKILGNGRLEADCFDGKKRLCHIRGKLRKKVWINQGDIILVGLRDYQDNKADVIMKYNAEEARNLKAYGEIPDNVKIEEDNDIEFDAAAAQTDPVVEGQSEEEESDESEEEEDDEEEDIPSWASKNPTRPTKWDRNHQRGKKNNETFIDKI